LVGWGSGSRYHRQSSDSVVAQHTTMLHLAILALAGAVGAQHSGGCPESYGLQLYPHESYCDKFYKCANGSLTEEVCENGLVFDGYGDVHNYCNYNWAADCGKRAYDETPISSPGCLYQYGIYPIGEGCQTTFFKCAAGVAYETPCQKGLAYSADHHLCDYTDRVPYCENKAADVVGFKCPANHELPPNAVARRFLPYPRFPNPQDASSYIICVNGEPRLLNCGDYSVFDEQTLTCLNYDEKTNPYYN